MKGFSYNIDLCVSCHACVAGCYLENGPLVGWRKINQEPYGLYPGLPVHNISLACNHCADASCMEGCPANAYYKDEVSGAVLLRAERCIGCNYCFWNCPYDAPIYNTFTKTVEKCTLCQDSLINGFDPACVSACPTGALKFNEFDSSVSNSILEDKDLNPRLKISGSINESLNIIPEIKNDQTGVPFTKKSKVEAKNEWVLILFSFLTSLLFAFNISAYFGRISIPDSIYIFLCVAVLALPMAHLGKPMRAWRSVAGLFRSPLSTEIGFLMLFIISSVLAVFLEIRIIWTISFIAGLILLITIDNVYTFSDKQLKTHTGQAFLTGLILASFMLGELVPFIFVGLIKTSALIYHDRLKGFSGHRLFQLIGYIIMLAISAFSLYLAGPLYLIMFIILCVGELINRITYYIDFTPVSHLKSFYNNILISYEKRQNPK